MKDIYVIDRPVDELGRIVIPKELRQQLHIMPKDRVGFAVTPNAEILIVPTARRCTVCGSMAVSDAEFETFKRVNDAFVCPTCCGKLGD